MSKMLRPVAAAMLLMSMEFSAANASSPPGDHFVQSRAEAFATCAGRLWALSVRQEALGDPSAPRTRQMQADFDMLLEAVLPLDGSANTSAQRWRLEGWTESAALLSRHQYGRSDRHRALAARQFAQQIDICERMIGAS